MYALMGSLTVNGIEWDLIDSYWWDSVDLMVLMIIGIRVFPYGTFL